MTHVEHPRRDGVVSEFFAGVRTLLGGFGWWRVRPGLMLLGLVPAAVVSLVLAAALVTLGFWIAPLAETLTPFANGWDAPWPFVVRIAAGTAVFGAALLLSATLFTALTLLIGEPFYDRIWRGVEAAEAPDEPLDTDGGFWAGIADAASLILRGILAAIIAFAVGLIPFVGGALGAITGILLSGWILADELSGRALTVRGIDHRARRRMLRAHRARAFGFGVATQLCFLIPLGAVLTMPAAVVGATRLARDVRPPASATPGAATSST
ncbi:EI24 domain-containing protein [Microbacterium sp. cx-59]|uniref:EI24 domain-containing protein n=1 Tax=Microbacterium sp. cx-59 TaxID=2891207 RepID=UPI001E5363B5|nr:EI24 domain-containing protein [Microbacterium sp. cx-59]MCC4906706.1 EI24 domain-containing protein [Microbacterium sp. cx-59]